MHKEKSLVIAIILCLFVKLTLAQKPVTVFHYTADSNMIEYSQYWADSGYNGFCAEPIVDWWDSNDTINSSVSKWRKANSALRLKNMNYTFVKKALGKRYEAEDRILPDWFDNSGWNDVNENFRATGEFINDINAAGLIIDVEPYSRDSAHIWDMNTHRQNNSSYYYWHPGTLGDGIGWICSIEAETNAEVQIVYCNGTTKYVWNTVVQSNHTAMLTNSYISNPSVHFLYGSPSTYAYYLFHVADDHEYPQLPVGTNITVCFSDGSNSYIWENTIGSDANSVVLDNSHLKNSPTPPEAWYRTIHPKAYFSLIQTNGGQLPSSGWYDGTYSSGSFTITYSDRYYVSEKVYGRAYECVSKALSEDSDARIWILCADIVIDQGQSLLTPFIVGAIDACRNYPNSKLVLGLEKCYSSKMGANSWFEGCDYLSENRFLQELIGQSFDGIHIVARGDYSVAFGSYPLAGGNSQYLLSASEFDSQMSAFQYKSDDYVFMYATGDGYTWKKQTLQESCDAKNVSFTGKTSGASSINITGLNSSIVNSVLPLRVIFNNRPYEYYFEYSDPGTLYDGYYFLLHVAESGSHLLNDGEAVRVIFDDGTNLYEWKTTILSYAGEVRLGNDVLATGSKTPSSSWYDGSHANSCFTIYGDNYIEWDKSSEANGVTYKVVINSGCNTIGTVPDNFYSDTHGDEFFTVKAAASIYQTDPGSMGDSILWLTHVGEAEHFIKGEQMHIIFRDGSTKYEWLSSTSGDANMVALGNTNLITGSPSSGWYDASHNINQFWVFKCFDHSDYEPILKCPTVMLFADIFESGNFTTGGWTKQDGNATVTTDYANTGIFSAKLTGTTWMQKMQSTAGCNTVHIKCNIKTTDMSGSQYLFVEWSTNGTTWTCLESNLRPTEWISKDYTCASGASNNDNFRVRFRTNDGTAYVDNVVITGIKQ